MVKTILYQDEIVFYWEKEWGVNAPHYVVYLDGKKQGETDKTHFTIYNLAPARKYEIKITRIVDGVEKTLFCDTITTAKARKYIDVTKPPYNALGDGKTLNTLALQKAIDDCKAGETVYIPTGIYLSGALNLHSDMELYVAKGATLQGSSSVKDYTPKIKSRFEGYTMSCYRSLLNMGELDENNFGYTCENVIIRGGGAILGGGVALLNDTVAVEKENLKEYLSEHSEVLKELKKEDIYYARARGRLINISNSKNVVISDLSLGYAPAWNVHFIYSKEIVTCNCSISSQGVWNGDGWDPDSSEDCTVFNVDFCTHDDAIAIKSGKNPEGNIINRPSKNIRIFDCRGRNGISIGSELSGGVEDVRIWDCSIVNGVAGFRLKTNKKRGGYVRKVKVKDCQFAEVRIYAGYTCNDDGASAETLTDIEDLTFEDVESFGHVVQWQMGGVTVNAPCVIVNGFAEKPIRNLTLRNIIIHAKEDNMPKKFNVSGVENFTVENLSVRKQQERKYDYD